MPRGTRVSQRRSVRGTRVREFQVDLATFPELFHSQCTPCLRTVVEDGVLAARRAVRQLLFE